MVLAYAYSPTETWAILILGVISLSLTAYGIYTYVKEKNDGSK